MPSTDKEILLKLDSPVGGQTYLGESAKFKFWIADPSKATSITKADFTYEILCQEVKDSLSSSYIGTMKEVVLFSSEGRELALPSLRVENISFKEGDVYNSPDGKISSPILEIKGDLRRDIDLFGTYQLKIRVSTKGTYITSNSVSFTFGSKEDFMGLTLGGPTKNLPELHYGRAIVVRGSSISLGSEIAFVEAIVPLATSIFVSHGLQFKELENSLPDLEEAKKSGIEIVALFDAPLESELVTFNVRVTFKSGECLDYYWGSTLVSTEIDESFVLSTLKEEGRWIKFEGNLFAPILKKVRIFLSSTRLIKEVNSDYLTFRQLERDSVEIDPSYFCSKGASKVSFLLPNEYLGNNPGSVSLDLTIDDLEVPVVGRHLRERLSRLFNNYSFGQKRKFLSRIFAWFGGKGLLPVKSIFLEVTPNKITSKKILFISHNLSLTEGAPKVLYSIIKHISKKFSSSIVSLREGEARIDLSGFVKEVNVLSEFDQVGLDLSRFHVGIDKANEILEKENPGLVIANGLDSFPLVCAAIDQGIKTFWIIHESIIPAHWYPLLPIAIRHRFLFALKFVDKIIFVSEKTRQLYTSFIDMDKSRVISNGIDFKEFSTSIERVDAEKEKIKLQVQADEFVLLTVGTITERKGQDRTIRELAILKRRNPDLKFKMFFVGGREAPFLWSLRQLVDKLGLEDNVFLIPETSDVAKYYAVADCFIVNSREESSPLVALEAFAAGLPVLSTTVFGLAELIIDGETALAFDGEKEGQLSGLIKRVATDGALRDELGANCSRFVRGNFSLDKMLSEYEGSIEEVLS